MRIVTTGDGSRTLFSERYQQTYHSTHGAVTESNTVFIEGSGLAIALESAYCENRAVRVLEIGFGLGLNFLLSADLAIQNQAKLAYTAIDDHFLNTSLLSDLDYRSQLRHPYLVDDLLHQMKQFESVNQSANATTVIPDGILLTPGPGVTLELRQALKTIVNWTSTPSSLFVPFDIIYLDAFSPDTNSECWQPSLLARLRQLLNSRGKLVTYSAKGSVRRSLQAAGFHIEKLPGPPGKREFLRANVTDPTIV